MSNLQRMKMSCDKYLFYTWVLDYLTLNTAYNEAESLELSIIENGAISNDIIKQNKYSYNDISAWLQEMQLIGLIKLTKVYGGKDEISITHEGFIAYKNQTYHVISAQLCEAYYSRKYATRAVYLALTSIIITIVIEIINILK